VPHKLEWLQDKRIIHEILIGQLDLNSSMAAAAETEKMLKEGIAPVHLIVDVTQMDKGLTNIRSVNSVNDYMKDPKLGWVVVVGANTVVKFISSIVSQVTRFRLSNANTVADAVAFLKKQDPSLTAEQAPTAD
jgi:hypothetical protein